MPDVFLEGTYWYYDPTHWADDPYSNIYNNKSHYLSLFKSIDFAFSQGIKYVQKAINVETYGGFNSDAMFAFNGNGLWLQAYNSIIHGATGIWFWDLEQAYDSPQDDTKKANRDNVNNPLRFDRTNFPQKYQNYIRFLTKELAYLTKKNLLHSDKKTIIYSKTDNADPNCIVPSSSTYIPDALTNMFGPLWYPGNGKYQQVANDGEAYGLRYTIRTNGNEVIMIISNPLPIPINNIVLNFNQLTNPIIVSSGGVDILFGDPSNAVTSTLYKTDRSNDADLNTLTLGTQDSYYVPFWANKQLQISFGPLDVKILRFVTHPSTPIVDYNNGWDKVWTNAGNNMIASWKLRLSDHIVKGDFNGDTDDELLCTQQISAYASLHDFYNGTWNTIWSNNGNNSIGSWLIRNSDILVVGNFDGDSKDELLCVQQESAYATMLKYDNNNWTTVWSNNGSNAIGTWLIRNSDILIAGDFDGDKKDELLCVQDISNYATMLKYVNGSWQAIWSNNGSGYIDNWQITDQQQYTATDFNNDGKDEIFCFNHTYTNTAQILQYITTLNDPVGDPAWKYSNTQLNGIPNWQNDLYVYTYGIYVPVRTVMTGNIDYDGKEELIYVSSNGNSKTAEYVDDNSCVVNWNNSMNAPYIDDWDATHFIANNYMLVKAEKYLPEYLMAFRGREDICNPFLVNMYRSLDMTNKRVMPGIPPVENQISNPEIKSDVTSNNISVFPNPTTGKFSVLTSISNKPVSRIIVINTLGETMHELEIKTKTLIEIDLSEAPNGIYIIKAICDRETFVNKIIKN